VVILDVNDLVILGGWLGASLVHTLDVVDAGQCGIKLDVLAHVFLVIVVLVLGRS
jgi:hypothetical protein